MAQDLHELLAQSDHVILCAPATEATYHLIDADAFAAMKPQAILIDISRGGIVDEPALVAALDEGRLRGVARDVFATEPLPEDHPLWAYDNVIVTPHCSAVC